ncbi:MAG TPA: sigma-70 family RNA polymerase sigma factor [Solirubrobacterales bacterium]|nr:sigma-70 family RNA polymerase sigma factor [Solirubrobacterales bacterium]
MGASEQAGGRPRAADEQRLARAAAAGDGEAFATLYERYERRAYNLALRITGSEDDAADALQDAFVGVLRRLPAQRGELVFGSYLFTATRNACYDLIEKRRRAEPSDSIADSATPVGPGGGRPDPGDPDEDPERRQLLASQREEIRAANDRLPPRQREVLALRELEGLSYDEIASIMAMNRNSVAQLISRARINLRAELGGVALEAIAVGEGCERALPLLARRDDGELGAGEEAAWLDAHLSGCGACRLRREAMQEAGVSYRAWAPVAVAPWLLERAMARAAECVGADWSETIAARAAARRASGERRRLRARRPLSLAAVAAAVLLLALLAAERLDNRGLRPERAPVAEEAAAPVPVGDAAVLRSHPRRHRAGNDGATVPAATSPPEAAPVPDGGAGSAADPAAPTREAEPNRGGGENAKRPPREPADQTPASTPPPAPEPGTSAPQPPSGGEPEPQPEPEREPPPPRPPSGPGDIRAPGPPPVP